MRARRTPAFPVQNPAAFKEALSALEELAGVQLLGLLTVSARVCICRNATCRKPFTNGAGCRPARYCCPRCEDTANKRAARRRRRFREAALSVTSARL